jgi:ADP-ribose pyrophosphatase YjhB (NUDIX family)
VKGLILRAAFLAYRIRWRLLRPITMGVRLLMIHDGQVVLVKHTYQSGWHMPGGGLKWGETPAMGAAREAWEEVGARLKQPPTLLGVYSSFDDGHNNHVLTYVTTEFELGAPPDSWEIAERGRFHVTALPDDVSDGTVRRIQDYEAGRGPYSGAW